MTKYRKILRPDMANFKEKLDSLISLPDYCREYDWPRKPQWLHWIYQRKPIAVQCVKTIGARYFIGIAAFEKHIDEAKLEVIEQTEEGEEI